MQSPLTRLYIHYFRYFLLSTSERIRICWMAISLSFFKRCGCGTRGSLRTLRSARALARHARCAATLRDAKRFCGAFPLIMTAFIFSMLEMQISWFIHLLGLMAKWLRTTSFLNPSNPRGLKFGLYSSSHKPRYSSVIRLRIQLLIVCCASSDLSFAMSVRHTKSSPLIFTTRTTVPRTSSSPVFFIATKPFADIVSTAFCFTAPVSPVLCGSNQSPSLQPKSLW